jgi:thiamine pyrophosphate-dependent acetolactate synthase large subunit-like protein
MAAVETPPRAHGTVHSGLGYSAPRVIPTDADLARAADALNAGKKVAMLVGAGALGARAEVLAVAERLGSPIVKTLPGKAAVPDDHPMTTGGIGLLGTAPSEDVMDGCDTLFMVGTNFPYTKHLPEPGQARVVQIDVDPTIVGTRVATEVPIVGDSKDSLQTLLPLLKQKDDRTFLDAAQRGMDDWRERMVAMEAADRDPIQPQYLMSLIDRYADDDAILASDSGTIATWSARHWRIRGDRFFLLSGNLATMAPGLPYSIAAQWAHPGRQCIAFVGDGGFGMLMAEFDTACRYDLPIKVFVNNNSSLGQILWEQMVLGYPEFGIRYEQYSHFAPWAEACGARAWEVTESRELDAAVRAALAHPGPALVDVHVNPDEPPMPAKVTYEQAKGFASAWLHGQPRKATMASTLFRDKIDQFRS